MYADELEKKFLREPYRVNSCTVDVEVGARQCLKELLAIAASDPDYRKKSWGRGSDALYSPADRLRLEAVHALGLRGTQELVIAKRACIDYFSWKACVLEDALADAKVKARVAYNNLMNFSGQRSHASGECYRLDDLVNQFQQLLDAGNEGAVERKRIQEEKRHTPEGVEANTQLTYLEGKIDVWKASLSSLANGLRAHAEAYKNATQIYLSGVKIHRQCDFDMRILTVTLDYVRNTLRVLENVSPADVIIDSGVMRRLEELRGRVDASIQQAYAAGDANFSYASANDDTRRLRALDTQLEETVRSAISAAMRN